MLLDLVERWARRLGGVGALAFAVAAYTGLLRNRRRAWGQESGSAPGLQRGLSTRYLFPVTIPAFAFLVWLWRPLPITLPRPARAVVVGVGSALYFAGIALMLWGRFTLGRSYGVSSSLGAQLYVDHELVTSGPFRYTRNPMYLGGQLAEVGALLLYRTWTTALIILNVPALVFRARRESEALRAEFGPAYDAYAAKVPFWLPFILS
jgi:protein-S-isoprenylcysteine O-methyltransferase Ste14